VEAEYAGFPRVATVMPSGVYDLLVVGGGINGVAIARDAAGRGLRVLLCEQGDLAGATSSVSSKLIHGGLRYLEHGAFRLVREGLAEREVLLRMAPHLVQPLRLVVPLGPASRPRWLLRAGLALYDRLGGARTLPASEPVDLRSGPFGAPLRDGLRHGFAYSDCRTDDARLTVVSARDAMLRGAEIVTRSTFTAARREAVCWRAVLRDCAGTDREVAARILVNAAGPWVPEVLARSGLSSRARLRLVKGSHIVVPRLYDGEQAYLLQNDDRRIVFVIPFERDWSLIGTTELPFTGDPGAAEISAAEIAYLCGAVARWFKTPPRPAETVWSYAGARPLYDDRAASAAAVSRDYVFELDAEGPPALSIFGGKLTTHRRLAEHALARLAPHLPVCGPPWTAGSVLPGGRSLPTGGTAALAGDLGRRYPFLDPPTVDRLARSYGADAYRILGQAKDAAALGHAFGHGLSEAELRWLVEHEWARTAADVLWRRSKLGLRLTPAQAREVAGFLMQRRASLQQEPPAAAIRVPPDQS
jgi:glycerol-3-phosphate dehydrogenase